MLEEQGRGASDLAAQCEISRMKLRVAPVTGRLGQLADAPLDFGAACGRGVASAGRARVFQGVQQRGRELPASRAVRRGAREDLAKAEHPGLSLSLCAELRQQRAAGHVLRKRAHELGPRAHECRRLGEREIAQRHVVDGGEPQVEQCLAHGSPSHHEIGEPHVHVGVERRTLESATNPVKLVAPGFAHHDRADQREIGFAGVVQNRAANAREKRRRIG